MLSKSNFHRILISEVRNGNLEKASYLINTYGLSYLPHSSQACELLCDALDYGHEGIAELLLTSGCDVDTKCSYSPTTPLHYAAAAGYVKIAEMIISRGVHVNAFNSHGKTAIHIAIEKNHMGIKELLLKHGADANIQVSGNSQIHVAAMTGCVQSMEALLNTGIPIDSVSTEIFIKGYTALCFAVQQNNKEMMEFLINRGASVNYKGEDHITPLHIAAQQGCTTIANYLLSCGASIDSLTLNRRYAPLHLACENNHVELVTLLLSQGASINICTKNNMTPLHIATKKGLETVVKKLLLHGASVDDLDNDGNTALYYAVADESLAIVRDILNYSPNLNNQSNRSALKVAVKGYGTGYQKILEALLKYGLVINPYEANNVELLYDSIKNGYVKIVEDLIKLGANVNTLDPLKGTPLHWATISKKDEIIKLLIDYKADINVKDKNGRIPLFYAIKSFDLNITKLLLAKQTDLLNSTETNEVPMKDSFNINAKNKCGETLLHFTVICQKRKNEFINDSIEIARLLLKRGANINAQTEKGLTTLHIAIEKGFERFVEFLLEHEANVNICTKNGDTPLHIAARYGNVNIVTMLLANGANISDEESMGHDALYLAKRNGHIEVVNLLIAASLRRNCYIKYDLKPLHLAAYNDSASDVKIILNSGVDIDLRNQLGRTALHTAAYALNFKAVKCLLNNGADINVTCKNDRTPIYYAAVGPERCKLRNINYPCGHVSVDHSVYFSRNKSLEILEQHAIKLKVAKLHVNKTNLEWINKFQRESNFQDNCEKEIQYLKTVKMTPNISMYDIFTQNTHQVAAYLKDRNLFQRLKSENFQAKYPIYARLIKARLVKALEMKQLLKDIDDYLRILFNGLPMLPNECTDIILSYLSVKDLKNLIDACTYPVQI